jgi:NADPH-dependent 7-cyano-7-deazaguanine reductase QueF-like protein
LEVFLLEKESNLVLDCLENTAIDYLNDLARDLGHDLEECAQMA